MKRIDLSGKWRYKIDMEGTYRFDGERFSEDGFELPGSACENCVGKKQEYYDRISKEAVRAPRERYEYIGPLWLQRDIEVAQEMLGEADKTTRQTAAGSVRLFLERVNIASELWIDGKKIGRRMIELSTPHMYDLTGRLTAGRHMVTLKIDNRNLLNIDTMASGYSIDTQGYWNGVIGRIDLQYEELFHIDDVQVYPDAAGIDVKVVETSDIHSFGVNKAGKIELNVFSPDGRELGGRQFDVELYTSRQSDYFRYDMENICCWDEFDPSLYALRVRYLYDGKIVDEKRVCFGMRTVKVQGKTILLNGKTLSLRGTTDCAIYPLTGYPPMDKETWRANFAVIKSYGLNYVRFHAWCPPEAAFCAADELGLYISVEMPLWLNRDVCALEFGEDPIHGQYYMQEALLISKTYGNHPSFLMFSNGNENIGDFALLNDITTCVKAYDPRRLYTLTTNFDHPVAPCEDYLCAFEAYGNPVRIQNCHDAVAKDTCLDYKKAVEETPAPVISFEVGQYCVYPDVDLIEDYTGNMMPVNLDAIKKYMIEKGVYNRRREYIQASGDLAVKLYKEDIEAALRTKNFGGFELLSLCDYTGQSTALVGILDVFFRSKGLIEPEKFREFAGPVVPLLKARRIFTNKETLEAELALYDFGKEKITAPEFCLEIFIGEKLFYRCVTKERQVRIPLDKIEKSSILEVALKVGEYRNSWRIFVFVPRKGKHNVRYIRTEQELKEIQRTGGTAIVTRECFRNPIQGSFIPVFWSPVHFPSQKPCGAVIDSAHPALAGFPTGRYLDYQWKRLFEHSVGENIFASGGWPEGKADVRPIIETVPNFFDNTPSSPLFEVKSDKMRLIFCGFDLDEECPEARQLQYSLECFCEEG